MHLINIAQALLHNIQLTAYSSLSNLQQIQAEVIRLCTLCSARNERMRTRFGTVFHVCAVTNTNAFKKLPKGAVFDHAYS